MIREEELNLQRVPGVKQAFLEGFLEEVAVDEDEEEFACPELWGRTFQA